MASARVSVYTVGMGSASGFLRAEARAGFDRVHKVDALRADRLVSRMHHKLISLNIGIALPRYIAFHAGDIGNGFKKKERKR